MSDDYKQAFYTMLLWKISSDMLDGKTVQHAPWKVGNHVCASDGRMALMIKASECTLPRFDDKTQGPRKFLPIEAAFCHLDPDADDWKPLDYVTLTITHISDDEGDPVKRDFFRRVQLIPGDPGVWIDSGRLYWFSLIPGVKFQVRGFGEKGHIFYFKWDDGVGAVCALSTGPGTEGD